ncbi:MULTISPECIES: DUF397 domain-containing protein [Actinomadura]|uniref:DUF397 domain-containing protein n=1 Tax=Actinomadura yumaensis TaxID=111807 RepID=A0ABW2CQ57_9ACTN|nr:DUF397 domain-containing protein [Actinomadura sp. J1-007]MWK34339.1 DUF397 domain-containing protein [Actinomadura sp. J1-007]
MENLNWRKSSRSGSNGGNCIELASSLCGRVAVRDSKDPQGPKLLVSRAALREAIQETGRKGRR